MAEYDAFHYLMHKEDGPTAVTYVTGPSPLTFQQLFSPRDKHRLIGKEEKSYWRTRDRIQYTVYEDRLNGIIIITCKSVEGEKSTFRTIFIDCVMLYFELQYKAKGNRDPIVKKAESKFSSDSELDKATMAFLSQRLNIGSDPIEWPVLRALGSDTADEKPKAEGSTPILTNAHEGEASLAAADEPAPHKERMVVFMVLTGDETFGRTMEVRCPDRYDLSGLENIHAFPPLLEPTASELKSEEETAVSDEAQTNHSTAVSGSNTSKNANAPAAANPTDSKSPTKTAVSKKPAGTLSPNKEPKGSGKPAAGSGAAAVKAAKNSPLKKAKS